MKKIIKICLCALVVIGVVGCAVLAASVRSTFVDTVDHPDSVAIDFVAQKGLMNGVSATEFAPDQTFSRGMLVTVIHRMAGLPQAKAVAGFGDVARGIWYADAVDWATEQGIIIGTSASTFSPNDPVTGEQMRLILSRYAMLEVKNMPNDVVQTEALPRAMTRAEVAVSLQKFVSGLSLSLADVDTGRLPVQQTEDIAFSTDRGPVTCTEQTITKPSAIYDRRVYRFSGDKSVVMGRVQTKQATEAQVLTSITLNGDSGTLRYYNGKNWVLQGLYEGVLPGRMYFVEVAGQQAIITTSQVYADRENGMREWLPDQNGTLSISRRDGAFTLTLQTPALPAAVRCEYLIAQSPGVLINWADGEEWAVDSEMSKWARFQLHDINRWCYDGYYYAAESDYYPNGKNYFYNLPACYAGAIMVNDAAADDGCRMLGMAMLDVMQRLVVDEGYVSSLAGSNWLKNDYGIEPGYYDTRFNTDLATAWLNAAENFGATAFIPYAQTYADYLEKHAAAHHYTFQTGAGEGWLVEDYAAPNGNLPTHVSLNHHAAEALFLYRIAEVTNTPRYAELADTMVRGIEATAEQWICADGNLHYAYLANGEMGLEDYPYLTYNDLRKLQDAIVVRNGGHGSVAVQKLCDSKRAWMDANGIVGTM